MQQYLSAYGHIIAMSKHKQMQKNILKNHMVISDAADLCSKSKLWPTDKM